MSELYLIVSIAGRRIAIPAAEVHSVIEVDSISPVPTAPPFIAGLAALRSKILTVIDCRHSLGLAEATAEAEQSSAVVIDQDGFLYALLVEDHDDVIEAEFDAASDPGAFGERWASVARGMVELDTGAALVIDVAGLISGPTGRLAA